MATKEKIIQIAIAPESNTKSGKIIALSNWGNIYEKIGYDAWECVTSPLD